MVHVVTKKGNEQNETKKIETQYRNFIYSKKGKNMHISKRGKLKEKGKKIAIKHLCIQGENNNINWKHKHDQNSGENTI
jgi:ABC-type transporter MlaC component